MAAFDVETTTAPGPRTGGGFGSESLLSVQWILPLRFRVLLLGSPLFVGRGEECAMSLKSEQVSRRHARIWRDGPLWLITDEGSRNGTYVNTQRIQQAPLAPGDVIRVGDAVGIVVRSVSEAEASNADFGELAENLYGGSALSRVIAPARKAASSNLPVMIEGETGTGKESVARAIHLWSGRTGSFVAVNCSALPQGLAEGLLFGHRRGAFTGAEQSSPGYLKAAHGGTLFLDELAELPAEIQPKLLRALDRGEVVPLGEAEARRVDVRVLAAVQGSAAQLVESGSLRADLAARLDGIALRLPPLRERPEDVFDLFQHFVREENGGELLAIEPRLVEYLCSYDFPMNVRELLALTRRMLVLHGHEPLLERSFLPDRVLQFRTAKSGSLPRVTDDLELRPSSREHELDILLEALRLHRGNLSQAARVSGISRQRAYRLLKSNGNDAGEALLDSMRTKFEGENPEEKAGEGSS